MSKNPISTRRVVIYCAVAVVVALAVWLYFAVATQNRVDRLVERLQSSDEAVSAGAAAELGRIRGGAAMRCLIHISVFQEKLRPVFASIGEPAVAPLMRVVTRRMPLYVKLNLPGSGDDAKEIMAAKASAAHALVAVGRPALPALIEALESDVTLGIGRSRINIRDGAARMLGEIGDPAAVGPLVRQLDRDLPRGAYIDSIAAALWKIGAPAVPALVAALGDEDRVVRTNAARTLGLMPDARAIAPLAERLRDGGEDVEVRAAAAIALGCAAVPYDSGWVREEPGNLYVRRNLKIPRPALVLKESEIAALMSALADGEPLMRKCAAWALGELREKGAVEVLVKVLRESTEAIVRQTAAEALGKIGDARAVRSLAEALGDSAPETAFAAAVALERIGSDEARAAVDGVLEQSDLTEVARDHRALIRAGEEGSQLALIAALERYGTLKMAVAFYFSDREELREAAYWWAVRRSLADELAAREYSDDRPHWGWVNWP